MFGQVKPVEIRLRVAAMPGREMLHSAKNTEHLWFFGTNGQGQLVEMSQGISEVVTGSH